MPPAGQPDLLHGSVPARSSVFGPKWRSRRRVRAQVRDAERERAFRARVDAARSVISTAVDVVADGWIQNAWYQVRDETDTVRTVTAGKLELLERGPVVASCLVGALVHAAGGRYAARGQATGDSLDLVWHAAFAEGQRFGVGFCPPPSIRSVRVLDLTRWNDRPGRCIGQVLELLDAADDLAIVEATNQRRR